MDFISIKDAARIEIFWIENNETKNVLEVTLQMRKISNRTVDLTSFISNVFLQ